MITQHGSQQKVFSLQYSTFIVRKSMIDVFPHVISLHRADEGNRGNVNLNNPLTNEAMPVHINSTQQKVMNMSTKCKMKKTLTLTVEFKL